MGSLPKSGNPSHLIQKSMFESFSTCHSTIRMKMATVIWILLITGVTNEALAQHLVSRATGDLCTLAQIEAKCCEPAFEQSSGGSIQWTTTDNGGGGKWETAQDFIRFNIANDKYCGGNTAKQQLGQAVLAFDNDHTKILILSM